MDTSDADNLTGEITGRYRLLEGLGDGAFARVYRATDLFLHRDVAIKVSRKGLADEKTIRALFVKEARIQSRLEHASIVPLYDVLSKNSRLHIVMRFVKGSHLRDSMRMRGGSLEPVEALSFMRQVLNAMDFAHGRGVIHRDLKPSNIQVTPAGEALVLDLGAARLLDAELTRSQRLVGTPLYMSPEQIDGRFTDARSDIYCLGLVLYELVTGKNPFANARNISELGRWHAERDPLAPHEVNPALPPEFGEAIMRALRKAPEDRYRACRDFAQALASSLGQESLAAMGHQDVRWDPRAPLAMPAQLRINDNDEVLQGDTVDISVGGIALQMEEPLPIGTQGIVELDLPDASGYANLRAEAVVTWCRPEKDSAASRVGMNFTGLTDKDRTAIASLVRDILALGQDSALNGNAEILYADTALLESVQWANSESL